MFPLIFIGVLSFGLSSYTIPDNSVCVPFDNLNVGAIVVSFSNVSVTNVLSVSICTCAFLAAEFLSILAYAYIPSALLNAFSSLFAYVEYVFTSAIKSNFIPVGLFNIFAIVLASVLNVTSSTSFFPADIFLSSSFSKLITASFKFSVPPYTVLATISCSETFLSSNFSKSIVASFNCTAPVPFFVAVIALSETSVFTFDPSYPYDIIFKSSS